MNVNAQAPLSDVGTMTTTDRTMTTDEVPVGTMLAAAARVQQLDVATMHERVRGIVAALMAGNAAVLEKKHAKQSECSG